MELLGTATLRNLAHWTIEGTRFPTEHKRARLRRSRGSPRNLLFVRGVADRALLDWGAALVYDRAGRLLQVVQDITVEASLSGRAPADPRPPARVIGWLAEGWRGRARRKGPEELVNFSDRRPYFPMDFRRGPVFRLIMSNPQARRPAPRIQEPERRQMALRASSLDDLVSF